MLQKRARAFFIDFFISSIFLGIYFWIFKTKDEQGEYVLRGWVHFVATMAIYYAYYIIQEGRNGQTIGKRLQGLRVVKADGTVLTWRDVRRRHAFDFFELYSLFFVSWILVLTDAPLHRRLGDRLAGTMVVEAAVAVKGEAGAATEMLQKMDEWISGYDMGMLLRRGMAFLIDMFCFLGVFSLCEVLFGRREMPFTYSFGDWDLAILLLVFFLYHVVQEALWKRTLGKRILALVVVRSDGRPFGWLDAVKRNVTGPIEVIFFPIALVAISTNRRGRRLGDWVAGTEVVARKK